MCDTFSMNERLRIGRAVLAGGLLVLACVAGLSADFPKSQGYVTDTASVLSADVRARIDSRIRAVEQQTTAEIAVVTVSALDGMSVEEYGTKLFNEWGIGKKGRDNGVLILVAPTEREIRIEVGYGLEPVLPDGLAGDVVRTNAIPSFKNGDYSAGILASVERIASIVEANEVVTPEERRRLANLASRGDMPPTLLTTPFFGAFVGIGAFMLGAGFRSKVFFPILFGSLFGGMPYLISLLPFMNVTHWVLTPFAIAMLVFGWRKGSSASFRAMAIGPRGAGSGRSGGWVMGGGSSSSSGGSSSSSGSGSSFGGGSSGGGGASGRW